MSYKTIILLLSTLVHFQPIQACGACSGNSELEPPKPDPRQTAQKIFDCINTSDLPRLKKILKDNTQDLKSFINLQEPNSKQTALMKAVLMGENNIVSTLLNYQQVDVTIPEKDGYTPMHAMVEQKVFLHHKLSKSHHRKSSKRG